MAKLEAKVSIEKIIHKALKNIINELWDKHDIKINSIDIDWNECSFPGCKDFIISGLKLETETFEKGKNYGREKTDTKKP